MKVKMFSETWLEGFAKEAEELGLDVDETKALLKYASQLSLMEDPNFAAGYSEEFDKLAGIWGNLGKSLAGVGKAMVSTPGRAALTTGLGLTGAYGLGKLYDKVRPYFGNTMEDARLMSRLQGTYNAEDAREMMEQHYANKDRAAAGRIKGRADTAKSIQETAGAGRRGGGSYFL